MIKGIAIKYKIPVFKPLAAVLPAPKELSTAAAQVEHCAEDMSGRSKDTMVKAMVFTNNFILQTYKAESFIYHTFLQ